MMYLSMVKTIHATLIVAISLATSASAAALDSSNPQAISQSSSSSPGPKINKTISADEMILFGSDGRIKIVPRADYKAYTGGVNLATAEQHNFNFTSGEDDEPHASTIEKRCKSRTVFTMKPVETYINWDVPMSGVVLAPPNSPASVNVNEGFSIANSLSLSNFGIGAAVKSFMKSSLDVNYGQSWTATYMAEYSFTIPPGKFGAVVINPLTTRHSGYVDVGCIGQARRTEFSGESYRPKSYSDSTWVEGLIGLCVGDTFPLPMCFGEGTI